MSGENSEKTAGRQAESPADASPASKEPVYFYQVEPMANISALTRPGGAQKAEAAHVSATASIFATFAHETSTAH